MQFCPRCGSKNQDDRSSCWKCLGQLQKADGKKTQRILLTDAAAPTSDFRPVVEPEPEPVAAVPIPELAEPEPEPTPAFTLDTPAAQPEIDEPAPQVASLGDVMIPSPTFGSDVQGIDDEASAEAVPILGLVNLPEDQQEPEPALFDETAIAPDFGTGGLSDEPLVTPDSQTDEEAGTPWWLTQDDAEETAQVDDKPVLDLDDGGLEIISPDDTGSIVSFADEDEDSDSEK